jgi:uncharacterized protein (DUF2235 family)
MRIFICHNYPGDDDKIILIGLSRGAFTVRRIAAFIHDIDLLSKTGLKYLDSVYRHWQTKTGYRVVSADFSVPQNTGFSVTQHER